MRGAHWASKVGTDKAPEPWKSTKLWADKKASKQTEFVNFLHAKGVSIPQFPWDLVGSGIGQMGNRSKYLWLHLWLCHLNNIISIVSTSDVQVGFMGILSFTVNDHPKFDNDLFPLESKYDANTGRIMQKKTVKKNWLAAGMEECADGVVRFNQQYVDKERAAMKHADARRYEKKRVAPPSDGPAVAPPSDGPAVAPPSDDGFHEVAVFLADRRLKRAKDLHDAATDELQRAKDVLKAATDELIAASEARVRLGY